MSTDAQQEFAPDAVGAALRDWKLWRDRRTESVTAPYGPLSLTGTYWLADHAEGRIPAIPGHWTVSPQGDAVVLTATEGDGLTLDGDSFAGEVRLTADGGPAADARVGRGERRLVVIVREGLWAVRDFDPGAQARRDFHGIEVTEYDERWSVPGHFTPYGESRTVLVTNADGRRRGLGLGGILAFDLDGQDHTLQVAVEEDGSLWAVFSDSTSGSGSYRFRFLRPTAPDPDGRTTVDFNRSLLPPCAFADHFVCPFPPPGNALDAAIEAGERRLAGG
ncbi:DUF1684 domain-containing protein [Streptomyces himalayensis]|uniref:DUF1684 domain-containing protein n=1 Tax=Streptomyces himalayensis subsp. himalayensis TaxID=2756131 RepID=A0A7W0IBZ7_9ACTN|nr:DUF1684 domain-containing protein [Streptomyces himalayensis]MBA2949968.1 DUF1684 domain-containing protein [Streptomyces himalayensis subsp. himalayensis]